jgi:hypothetical protein
MSLHTKLFLSTTTKLTPGRFLCRIEIFKSYTKIEIT